MAVFDWPVEDRVVIERENRGAHPVASRPCMALSLDSGGEGYIVEPASNRQGIFRGDKQGDDIKICFRFRPERERRPDLRSGASRSSRA